MIICGECEKIPELCKTCGHLNVKASMSVTGHCEPVYGQCTMADAGEDCPYDRVRAVLDDDYLAECRVEQRNKQDVTRAEIVIQRLDGIIDAIADDGIVTVGFDDAETLCEAMALLKKQVPEKRSSRTGNNGFSIVWTCPRCGADLNPNSGVAKYCSRCGKAVAWP